MTGLDGAAARIAGANMDARIKRCRYPGRGLVMGLSGDGRSVLQAYWIMGRSDNSRNRVFRAEGGRVWTEAADPARCKDPSLILYDAMLETGPHRIVSNGDQTRSIAESLFAGHGFESALAAREREPDAPNFTPRISGMVTLDDGAPFYRFAVLKANRADPSRSDRHFFQVRAMAPGTGLCLTTYLGDGSPLPSFEGEPFLLPLAGSPEEVLDEYWRSLDADNRISLALKVIDPAGAPPRVLLRNRFSRVPPA